MVQCVKGRGTEVLCDHFTNFWGFFWSLCGYFLSFGVVTFHHEILVVPGGPGSPIR